MNHVKEVAEFITDLELFGLPENVIDEAKFAILDSLGAAMGAANYEEIPAIVAQISAATPEMREGGAQIWGHNRRSDMFQTTFLNGLMGHALELDDVHTGSKTHIGAVVVPAAWSLADAISATGAELLEAVIAGYEVMARIGEGFGVACHRLKGWHVTGTAGTFGAAAACAKLLGLTTRQTVSALGMAGTQSSGVWAFLGDGASCKKLHPARAAVNGLTAAMMAKAGMTGPEHILDAEDGGLYPATSDGYDMNVVTRNLGQKYEILFLDRKPYPCCRSTHCAIAAALEATEESSALVDRIESIQVETYDIGLKQCGNQRYPRSPVEAKFSTPYTVAAALLDGEVFLDQFTRERIDEEQIQKLAGKVKVKEAAEFTMRYPEQWGCRLTFYLTDGSVVEKEIFDAPGSVQTPLERKQLEDKFTTLVQPVAGGEQCEVLRQSILALEHEAQLPKTTPQIL